VFRFNVKVIDSQNDSYDHIVMSDVDSNNNQGRLEKFFVWFMLLLLAGLKWFQQVFQLSFWKLVNAQMLTIWVLCDKHLLNKQLMTCLCKHALNWKWKLVFRLLTCLMYTFNPLLVLRGLLLACLVLDTS